MARKRKTRTKKNKSISQEAGELSGKVRKFESITEFTDYVSYGKRGEGAATQSTDTDDSNSRFSCADNWKQAVDIATEGVEVQSVAEQADRIKERIGNNETQDFDTVWDVAGDIPDVGLYLSGEPECMLRFVPQEAAAHIDLVVSGSEGGVVDPKTIQQRAAGIASLCELLEQVNIYPAVYVAYGMASTQHEQADTILIKAKDYSDPVDRGMLSGVLWPSTLRRLMFKYAEMKFPRASADGSYGIILRSYQIKERLDLTESYVFRSITEDCFSEGSRREDDYKNDLESIVQEWFNSIYQDFE